MKNTITVSITISQIIPCCSDAINDILQAVWSFKLSHYKRESSVSDIKKKQVKKE